MENANRILREDVEQPGLVDPYEATKIPEAPRDGEKYADMLTVKILHDLQRTIMAELNAQHANIPTGASDDYVQIMEAELAQVNAFIESRATALTLRVEELGKRAVVPAEAPQRTI